MTPANDLLHHLRTNGLRLRGESASDGQLLDRFLADRDEVAFDGLLARHGPMVWAVCRRQLGDGQDAEDAFQATFLVLVRKGRTVQPRDRVGNWLYGVAFHAARKVRVDRARRREKEMRAAVTSDSAGPDPREANDLAAWLDLELSRLPEKYRAPVVLCDLEGKTRQEAARHLGWPEGTVAGRLARARAMLAKRLGKHGLAIGPAALAAALAEQGTAKGPPAAVVAGTRDGVLRSAAGQLAGVSPQAQLVMEGVVKAMLVKKLRGAILGLGLMLAAGLAVGGLADRFAAAQPAPARAPRTASPDTPVADKSPRPEDDLARLVGTWKVVSGLIAAGTGVREMTPAELRGAEVTIDRDATLTFAKGGPAGQTCFVVKVDASTSPPQMNLYPVGKDEDKCLRAVYRFNEAGRLELNCRDSFADGSYPLTVGAVGPRNGRYLELERVEKSTTSDRPTDKKDVERPRLPADQAKVIREQLAGTWQVESGERAGKPLTAWERRGYLLGISPDGVLTAHRGEVAGRRALICALDLSTSPPLLNLTGVGDPEGQAVHVAYELKDGKLILQWRDKFGGPNPNLGADVDGLARRLVLTRYGSMAANERRPIGLAVTPDPKNVVSAHLEGRWRFDDAMTRRLAGADPGKWKDVSRVEVTITSDPAVAGQVPAAYRELLAGKRIYMAGHMTMRDQTFTRAPRTTTSPFVLVEHAGNPVLVSFDQIDDRPWATEQAMVVSLVPAASPGDDLLFLSPLDPGDGERAGCLRRVTGRR